MASKTNKAKKAKKNTGTISSKPKRSNSAKSTSTTTHVPTPWAKLRQMWEAGESYEAMAKATDAHYDASKSDPTKPTRAKIWKARNVGVQIEGKPVKFGERGKGKESGKKGKATKGVKKASEKGKATKNGNKTKSRPEEMKPKAAATSDKLTNDPESAKDIKQT